jgi:preprotein translocase subunit SecB
MAEAPANGAAEGQTLPPQPKVQVIAQYIRDLSFENVAAQKGLTGDGQPDIQVQVNLDARKRNVENQYEVSTKLKIEAKTKADAQMIFLMELDYTGVFQIENVPDEQMHPFLLIECPRLVFPFVRRVVSDVSRDGGFPPLNLEQIDFVALYRNELLRRQAASGAATPTADA